MIGIQTAPGGGLRASVECRHHPPGKLPKQRLQTRRLRQRAMFAAVARRKLQRCRCVELAFDQTPAEGRVALGVSCAATQISVLARRGSEGKKGVARRGSEYLLMLWKVNLTPFLVHLQGDRDGHAGHVILWLLPELVSPLQNVRLPGVHRHSSRCSLFFDRLWCHACALVADNRCRVLVGAEVLDPVAVGGEVVDSTRRGFVGDSDLGGRTTYSTRSEVPRNLRIGRTHQQWTEQNHKRCTLHGLTPWCSTQKIVVRYRNAGKQQPLLLHGE